MQAPAFRQHLGALEGDTLTRVPRGFDPAHPAADYLKFKDWMVSRSLPGTFVTEPAFYPTLLAIFRAAAPLIRFLNEPIASLGAKRCRAGRSRTASNRASADYDGPARSTRLSTLPVALIGSAVAELDVARRLVGGHPLAAPGDDLVLGRGLARLGGRRTP